MKLTGNTIFITGGGSGIGRNPEVQRDPIRLREYGDRGVANVEAFRAMWQGKTRGKTVFTR